MDSSSDSPSTALLLGPATVGPRGPLQLHGRSRVCSCGRLRGSVPAVPHQAAADKQQQQLHKFLCELSKSHPHRWVDSGQWGLSPRSTGA